MCASRSSSGWWSDARPDLSWLGEWVDLPEDVTLEHLHAALVKVGLEEEDVHALRPHRSDRGRPGHLGRARTAEQRQDDQLVPGGCRRSRAARHRLRRPQLRRRRQGRRDAAGSRAARTVPDRGAQDLRAHLRRHDRLGARARPRRRARRHPASGRPGTRRAGSAPTRSSCSAWTTPPSRSTSRPTAATRSRSAASPASTRTRRARRSATRPTPSTVVDADRDLRRDDRRRRPDPRPRRAARSSRRASCAASTPTRPTPPWMASRLRLAGIRSISLPVDITNYTMLELGQPIHGYDLGKLQGGMVVRRATKGEKLETLDGTVRTLDPEDLVVTDDSGPIGLARRDGRRVDRDVGDHHRRAGRGGDLGSGDDRPHRSPAQAAERGRQALRARRRPEDVARSPRRASSQLLVDLAGGTADPLGADDRRLGRRRRPSTCRCRCRPSLVGVEYTPRAGRSTPRADRRDRRRRRASVADGHPADLAPRPHRRPDARRRGRPHHRVPPRSRRSCRSRLRAAGSPARSRRAAAPRRRWPPRARPRCSAYPFVSAATIERFEPGATAIKLANALDPHARAAAPHAAARPARDRPPQPVARAHRSRAVRDRNRLPSRARRRAGHRLHPGRSRAPRRRDAREARRRHPAAGLAGGRAVPRRCVAQAAGRGRGAGRPRPTRSTSCASSGWRWRSTPTVAAGLAPRPASRAARPRCASATASSASPASCCRRSPPSSTCRASSRWSSSTSTRSSSSARPRSRRVRSAPCPPRRRTCRSSCPSTIPAGEVLAAVVEGAGELLEHARLVDDYRGTGVPEGSKSLTLALRFRAADRTLTAAEATEAKLAGAAARRRRVSARPSASSQDARMPGARSQSRRTDRRSRGARSYFLPAPEQSAEQVARDLLALRARQQAAEQVADAAADESAGAARRSRRGCGLGLAAEELAGQPRQHDRRDDRQHLLDDVAGHVALGAGTGELASRRRRCWRRRRCLTIFWPSSRVDVLDRLARFPCCGA